MKIFILKSVLFFVIIVGILSLILVMYGGYIDYFYEKFTTQKAHSIIIGDSRGLQGIQPQILDSLLVDTKLGLPIQNYSFTIAQSRIGPLYTKSILKKLNTDTKNGLFIIAVNPWMLSSKKTNDNKNGEFTEAGSPPHNMNFVDQNPNFEYVIKNLNYFHFRGIFRKKSKLHKNGWLEENNLPKNSLIFKNWKKNQLKIFKGFTENYEVSEYRKKSLHTLIQTLKPYGNVFLLRTPIDTEMLTLEDEFFANFDSFIASIAKKNHISYFNYNQGVSKIKFSTYDGHHINKFRGVIFTKTLSDSIRVSLPLYKK